MRTDRSRRGLLVAGWVVSGGVLAVTAVMWQLHVREVEQRAAEAERTRDEVARRRAVEERLRIARELHDSLTHSISVISVQAGVAVHLARKRGQEVPASLLAIQEAGADALRELRTTLGVLREEDGDGNGLAQLDSLVARARAGGLAVTVTVTGTKDGRALAPGVDQAAYRIVQEALTNVARHAAGAAAQVQLCYAPDGVVVQVDNDAAGDGPAGGGGAGDGAAGGPGGGVRPGGGGLGLIGMRERVGALGGRLDAGPRPGGGFRVRAEFPPRGVS
jgi:signal transduction histidine kinase